MLTIPWDNPEFITYSGGDRNVCHIRVPQFIKDCNLFTTYSSESFCGNGSTVNKSDDTYEGYMKRTVEFHNSIPEGFMLCKYCAQRIKKEVMPFYVD